MDLVFVDANVLFSRTLRDWTLMIGAECNRFAVISSRDCLVEAIAKIRERNPAAEGGMIHHIHDLIERSLHDLITTYPGGPIDGIADEKDWHVIHAATEAGAKILVTSNVRDFAPVAESLPFDLYSPDELFDLVWKNDPRAVEQVTREQLRYWNDRAERFKAESRPAPKGLSRALRDAGASGFADTITQILHKLSGEKESLTSSATAEFRSSGVSSASPSRGPS